MTTTGPEKDDMFNRLLEAMPRIAEAANAFSSEENQRAALDALVRAMGLGHGSSHAPGVTVSEAGAPASGELSVDASKSPLDGPSPAPKAAPARRRRSGRKWEPVRNIDFFPKGKQSIVEMSEEKLPTNADQRNVVAVFWLEQVGAISPIGVGQVLAAFKACGWPEPANPSNALQVTASRMGWIDTAEMTALTTTPTGRNFVQHRMPLIKPEKKS